MEYFLTIKSIPDHVLEKIFEKIINPLQVLKFRVVSKVWGDIIESRFKNLEIWQKLCHDNDKIKPWIYNIIEKRFPRAKKNWDVPLYQKAWKKIFFSYMKWQMIKSFLYLNFKLKVIGSISRDKIECIEVWANYVAVGTRMGRIIFYTYNAEFQPIFERKYQFHSIMKIKFWYTETKNLIAVIQLNKLLGYAQLKFWDVKNLQYISNPFKDDNVKNYVCNNHRLFIATSEIIYEMKWNEGELTIGQVIEFANFLQTVYKKLKVFDMCADPKKLSVAIDNNENIVSVLIFKIPRDNRELFSLLDHSQSAEMLGLIENIACYMPLPGIAIFRNDVLISINVSYKSLEIIPTSTVYLSRRPPFTDKFGISSIFLYCNILLLGLRTGKIMLLFLENVKNLIYFNNFPNRTIDVCHDPIIHLNIIKIYEILYIFAATETNLHFVQFIHDI